MSIREEYLKEIHARFTKEIVALTKMCSLLEWDPRELPEKMEEQLPHPGCKILTAAMFSAKGTIPKGSPRRVFVQDLAASLERKKLLIGKRAREFTDVGYEYMET